MAQMTLVQTYGSLQGDKVVMLLYFITPLMGKHGTLVAAHILAWDLATSTIFSHFKIPMKLDILSSP
jgi:hypothetical protein